MYCVTVLFETKPDHAEAFADRVRQQALDSLNKETGCLRFDVWTSEQRPTRFFLYEIYANAAAFDLHLASSHMKAFNAVIEHWVVSKTVDRWDVSSHEGSP